MSCFYFLLWMFPKYEEFDNYSGMTDLMNEDMFIANQAGAQF